jgi:hypothetical protein
MNRKKKNPSPEQREKKLATRDLIFLFVGFGCCKQHQQRTRKMDNTQAPMEVDNVESASQAAPKFPVPHREFVCIEYPAKVVNIEKALQTLGGLKNVANVRTLFLYVHSLD